MNEEASLAYIEQYRVPTLKRRDIVVADNAPFHNVAGVEQAIQAAPQASAKNGSMILNRAISGVSA